jgi:hypothetical protein
MAGAGRHAPPGLGPSQRVHQGQQHQGQQQQAQQQAQQRAQQQAQQQPRGVDVSDVMRLYLQPPAQQQAQQQPVQGAAARSNPFARQQQAGAPPSYAAVAAGDGGAAEQPVAAAEAEAEAQPGSLEQCSSLATAGSAASDTGWAAAPRPLQAITNLPPPLPQQQVAQQQNCGVAEQLWDCGEQYQAQRAPPQLAALAGSKCKSSGGSGGAGGKKGGARPLAPPSQRISRFFVPKAKPE